MAEPKTKRNEGSVKAFLDAIEDERRRKDSVAVVALMKRVTGEEPKMWGTSIVGFGSYHYVYESGREGDAPLLGFSPRKQALTLYVALGSGGFEGLLKKLGKHETGKGCLYLKQLSDVDVNVLEELLARSFEAQKRKNR